MTEPTSGIADSEPAEPVVVGRYILWDVIGGGGMARVHVGRMLGAGGFSRTVAIKRLHKANAAAFTSMIVDEARLASRIRHPNVVPPLDVVVSGNELLLVMEYVHGVSLAKLVELSQERGAAVPLPIALRIAIDVLAGLEAAHTARSERGRALDIVHRDISPQNIIVDLEGVARIVDFGIAKAEGKLVVTRAGQIKGKLGYMAPEQITGADVDRRADIYATGIVLWELLAGRRLFERTAATLGADVQRLMKKPVPPPSKHRHVPAAVDAVVRRALEADRESRYGSAAEMATALERAAQAANGRELGVWVGDLAVEELVQRDEVLARIEQLSSVRPEPVIPAEVLAASPFGARPSDPAPVAAAPSPAAGRPYDDLVTANVTLPLPTLAPRPEVDPSDTEPTQPDFVPPPSEPDGDPEARRARAALVWGAVLGALCAVLLAMAFVLAAGRSRPPPAASPALDPDDEPAAVAPPSAPPVQPTAAAPPAETAPPPAETAPSPAETAAPPAETPPRPAHVIADAGLEHRPPKTTPPPPPKRKPKTPDCEVPYTIDSAGFRVPRRECLDR